MADAHKDEVASLMQKLHTQSDTAFMKLKEVVMEAVDVPPVAMVTEEQLVRLHQLEDLVGQQKTSYEAKLEHVRREAEQAKQVHETSLTHCQGEMEEMRKNHQAETESRCCVCG